MKQMVAAVDRSESSLRAADLAANLANKYDAELVLLTVGHETTTPDPGVEAYAKIEHIRDPIPSVMVESVRDDLIAVRERAVSKGAQRVSIEVVVGDPAKQILAVADAKQADLIVLGSRGHGQLTGLLLGSVAQKVVALSRCPVLVVH
jgi:nucleotide-binding universal stress UspA family protein